MPSSADSDFPALAQDATEKPPHFKLADAAALAALLAVLLAVFWKLVFTHAMLFYRDVYNYTYPSARYIHDLCRQGALPYWNPYLNYGQPLLANPNLLFFYPSTLAIVLLPIDLAYKLHYLAHFALAGIGTYLVARRWGQSRAAAFLAASVFTFSGPMLSLGNLYNHVACAAWIPWALLATERALATPPATGRRILPYGAGLRPWLLLTVVFSLQFLAGEPFTLLATFGLCFAYAVWQQQMGIGDGGLGVKGVGRGRNPEAPTPNPESRFTRVFTGATAKTVLSFFLVGCLMVLLSAVQFLPAGDFLSHSRRGTAGLRFAETSVWSFHPLSLLEVVAPDFFGFQQASPTGWMGLLNDNNFPYFRSVFIGMVPLFLAWTGWAFGRDRRRNFVALAALALLLLSFGHFTPVFALAYLLVPLLELVRFPVKLLVPAVLLVGILAGWGLDALRLDCEHWRERRQRVLLPLKALLACVVAILGFSLLAPGPMATLTRSCIEATGHGHRPTGAAEIQPMANYFVVMTRAYFPGLAGFTLGGLLIVVGLERKKAWARYGLWGFALFGLGQLVQANYGANPTVPRSYYTYQPPMLREFKGQPGTYRISSPLRSFLAPGEKAELQSFVNFQSIPEAADLPPVARGAFQLALLLATGSMLHGVEANINLDLERSLPPYLYDLEIYLNRQAPGPLYADCLLGRTNVKYILHPKREDSPATRLVSEVFNGSPQPSYLYESLCFVPRAYVAGTSLFSTDSLDTLRRLASPDFQAMDNVILATPTGSAPSVQGSSPAGQVESVEHAPNRVKLAVELSRPGYVVLLERYDPNWHATVDGREATVLRANQLFRAVYTEPGRHEVDFYYRQRGLKAGLVISFATITLLVALFALPENRRYFRW